MTFFLDPADERLHVPLETPIWRESFWLDAHDPVRGISLVIYAHARPQSGLSDLFVTIFGLPGGTVVHDIHAQPYPAAHRGSTASIPGLQYGFGPEKEQVTAALDCAGVRARLLFDPTGPVFDYDWEAQTASRHYEQFGIVTGEIETAADTIPFAGPGTRDHAWGARAKVPWRRWVWVTARFPENRGWSACIVDWDEPLLLGYATDPAPCELDFAHIAFAAAGSDLTGATLAMRAGSFQTTARMTPSLTMPRSGSDPTKGGDYHYHFVEVEDDRYGRGHGLLNVYSTLGGSAALLPISAGAE